MTFVRRFDFDPGQEVITAIEGIVIIGRQPPSQINGAGTGVVLCVGEFEDGPFNKPLEVENGGDLLATFGGFGYVNDGQQSCNPCARARYADAAVTPEYWNGNGFIALVSKAFAGLICCRVDTSVGSEQFTRLPSLKGNAQTTWALLPGQTVEFDLGAGAVTSAFDAAAASLPSDAGTYPTTFGSGESMNVTVDQGTPQQIGPVDIHFTSGDQSQAQVMARINAVLGYTAATDGGGAVIDLAGRVQGTSGNVTINSVSDGLITTAIGFAAADTAAGTGDVANIAGVTFNEAKITIEADIPGTRVERAPDGSIRVAATSASSLLYVTGTATAFGFTALQVSQEPNGYATLVTGAGTYNTGFGGGETLTLGADGDANVMVTFASGDQTRAQVISRVNAAMGYTAFVADTVSTKIRFTGRVNGGQVRVVAASSGGVLTTLGLVVETIVAVAHTSDVIPAGSRLRNTAGTEWVTMQSTAVAANNPGPYSIMVRPGLDDGTVGSAAPGTVTNLVDSLAASAWSVTNPATLNAALTEAAIDAAYQTAFTATLALSAVTRKANLSFAARQSNALRSMTRLNAVLANSGGLAGRYSFIRPPLGTTRANAKDPALQPGVGANRSKVGSYAYPGVEIFVPQIAARGVAGGAGFTADGLIDVGFDSWEASLCSQLPPEENPGQQTDFALAVVGLEKNNPDVQAMDINDYIAFKAAGIAAPIIDEGVCQIQSAVTSVDPQSQPAFVDINRQRMEFFIQDSLASGLKSFSKKLMTRQRRADLLGTENGFMNGLLSPNNPASQRIAAYSIDAKSGNTKATLAAGIFRTIVRTQTLPDFKDIVLETITGPNVDVTVGPPAA